MTIKKIIKISNNFSKSLEKKGQEEVKTVERNLNNEKILRNPLQKENKEKNEIKETEHSLKQGECNHDIKEFKQKFTYATFLKDL